MEITSDELPGDARRIRLTGRLDMKGSGEIELRFTSLSSTDSKPILVDMSGVDFIASIGMRLLLTCAKSKALRGGKLVLSGLQPGVHDALSTAGFDSLIPMYSDEKAALAGLGV